MLHLLTFIALLGWGYLFFLHGKYWQLLEFASESPVPSEWPAVSIIVPARNEAEMLNETLPALLAQDYPGAWQVILVNDRSTDHTAVLAQAIAAKHVNGSRFRLLDGTSPPPGWKGKVAAMQRGFAAATGDYVLFTDADIHHPPESLRQLVTEAQAKHLDMLSLMVKLRCSSFAEQLLIPAFVYFFQLLYPFRQANDRDHPAAAAAGGVMLIKKALLDRIDGLQRIHDELIDDCALARVIKHECGGRTWLGLSREVRSLRVYDTITAVWEMIARTAFTQLNYSAPMLIGCVTGLSLMFLMPFWAILSGSIIAFLAGLKIMFFMFASYRPMIRFYGLGWPWALTLPLAALIYLAATIDSARLYWQGQGGRWKGLAQANSR